MWRNATTTSLTLFSYMTSGLFQENQVRKLCEVTHMWHTAGSERLRSTNWTFFVPTRRHTWNPFVSGETTRVLLHIALKLTADPLWKFQALVVGSCVSQRYPALSLVVASIAKLRKVCQVPAIGHRQRYFTRRQFEMWITLLCQIYLMWLWSDCTKHLY